MKKGTGSPFRFRFFFLSLYVSPCRSYTPSDFLIPKMRRRIPLKNLGLRKETTFIPSPPNKSFCTESRQTAPAEPPIRPIKTALGKTGLQEAQRRTQLKSFPCCFPDVSQAAPPLRKMKGISSLQASVFPHMLTFSICRPSESVRKDHRSSNHFNLLRIKATASRFSQKPRHRTIGFHC